MKQYTVYIETDLCGSRVEEDFEIEDDATEEEIEEYAREIAFNHVNWAWILKDDTK